MNSSQIIKLLCNLPDRYTIGVFPSNRIPKLWRKPAAFVFNTHSDALPGQHWIAIHVTPEGRGTYFDSYGLPPVIKDHVKAIDQNCKNLAWNSTVLQSETSKVCGHFCLMYLDCLSKGQTLQEFLTHFSKDLKSNDKIAALYVNKLRRSKRGKKQNKSNISGGSHQSVREVGAGIYRNSKVQYCRCRNIPQKWR